MGATAFSLLPDRNVLSLYLLPVVASLAAPAAAPPRLLCCSPTSVLPLQSLDSYVIAANYQPPWEVTELHPYIAQTPNTLLMLKTYLEEQGATYGALHVAACDMAQHVTCCPLHALPSCLSCATPGSSCKSSIRWGSPTSPLRPHQSTHVPQLGTYGLPCIWHRECCWSMQGPATAAV